MHKIRSQSGNMSIFAVFLVFLLAFVALVLSDFSRILFTRTAAKKAADSAVLAASQEILYFNNENITGIAQKNAEENNCSLESVSINYDSAEVTVSKYLEFYFIKYFGPDGIKVYATSTVKVVFPWDEKFNACDRIRFDFE
jgi:uncharacterized membrane protein